MSRLTPEEVFNTIVDVLDENAIDLPKLAANQHVRHQLARHIRSALEFAEANPRPYPCGAFDTATGDQCTLESDHGGEHVMGGE